MDESVERVIHEAKRIMHWDDREEGTTGTVHTYVSYDYEPHKENCALCAALKGLHG